MRLPWRRRRREAELDEEIRGHLAEAARDREARGESPDEAAYAARREFGNPTLVKEVTRQMWGGVWLANLGQDLRLAIRTLRRSAGFTSVAVLTLALGIGANTGVFSVANAVLLQPGPYPHPERLVQLSEIDHGATMAYSTFSPPDYADLAAMSTSYMKVAAWTGLRTIVTGNGEPEAIRGARVTATFFPVLGVQPLRGRLFTPEEDRPGNDHVVLIGESLWRRRFNADPRAIGTTVALDGVDHIIVGVIPQAALFPATGELFAPLAISPADLSDSHRGFYYLMAIARLEPGVSLQRAWAGANAAARNITRGHPSSNARQGIGLVPWARLRVAGALPPLLVLLVASGFVLLIACANLVGLLLVRAAARERELAIRAALGASRARMLRPLLVETAVLAALGGIAALLVSRWVVLLLVAVQPGHFSLVTGLTRIALDARVLGFAAMLTALAALGCMVATSVQMSSRGLHALLAVAGHASSGGRRGANLRRAFVVAEVALAMILLSGAGLMMESLGRLLSVDPGFDPSGVLAMELPLPAKDARPDERLAAYRRILEQAAAVPGIGEAGLIDLLPFGRSDVGTGFTIEGRQGNGASGGASIRIVSPSYLATMRTPLLTGRGFSHDDGPGSPRVVLINQTMARRYWPGASPLGQRLRLYEGESPVSVEVAGVVGDVRFSALDADPQPEFYCPYSQSPSPSMWLVVRTKGDPASLAAPLRAALRELDPEQPIARVSTMDRLILDSPTVVSRRSLAIVLAALSASALLLAAVGVFGVVSQAAAQRTQEIGVRRVLGASGAGVIRLVLGDVLALSLAGTLVGFTGAYALTQVLNSVLFQVGPHDPLALGGAAVLLVVVALAASAMPAIRAVRVDPMAALRYE